MPEKLPVATRGKTGRTTKVALTITFSASQINGQVQDSRTFSYAQLVRMVQPAA